MKFTKYLYFSIALISLISLFGLYFYSLENLTKFLDAYPPFDYAFQNIEEFEGKEIYTTLEVKKISKEKNEVIGVYHSIFPRSNNEKNLEINLINEKNFELKEGNKYKFKVKISDGKIYIIEKYNPLIQWNFVIEAILFNVTAVIIMLYLLSKLKINFRKFLIEEK